ncbi:putative cytochrome P450 [Phaeosphaeria sp. MPI-PUGE-AT-0046c]|nr:putative cytochrome P450 [Phaeosphaeria sp. MPI-PUGE-AT-0046c]
MFSLLLVSLVLVGLLIYAGATIGRRERGLPPGPPTVPFLGNLLQIPTSRTHLKFREWARRYGGIFSLKIGTGTAIVITSPRLVRELLDKKSGIYSHRPPSFVGNNIIGGGDHVLLMQYGQQWRTARRAIHQYFQTSMVMSNHLPLVEAEAVQMVNDLIAEPEGHMQHPKRFSNNSIIMSLVYGTRTPNSETVHMKKLYSLMENWSKVMEPGSTPPVDIFPFLKWVPEQFLGMWRTRAKEVSNEMNELYNTWHQYVIDRRMTSGSRDCFLDRLLDQEEKLDLDRHALYFLCGTLMEGGSDTTSSIIIAFIHALTKWPDVLKKAHEEIDRVIGSDRTPVWGDYPNLPYIAACVKETQRFRPVVPLAFPHSLAEDDEIDGMKLPKGSDIFINAFGMQHDEERFPDPDIFDPDHYKGVTALASELATAPADKRDHYGYGAGRRLCPGINLAERNLFLAFAKLVWALDIKRGLDSKGNPLEPDLSNEHAYSAGFLVCAKAYPCRITSRSKERRETVSRELRKANTEVFSLYENPLN